MSLEEKFAIEHCKHVLHGWDRDGYDLWWKVPSFYPEEVLYLLEKKILARNKEGLVAWKSRLEEQYEL